MIARLGEKRMATDFVADVRAALIGELEQLRDAVREIVNGLSDQELWTKPMDPGNSVGHLVLHLTGNLNHFVGAQLGHTAYVREREKEFTDAHPPTRQELLANLDGAVTTFGRVVGGLSEEQLRAPHPEGRLGMVVRGLMHLLTHFALHRGQMSYIVRLVKQAK
jgi:uncharacterized damage-inducible protein DinB